MEHNKDIFTSDNLLGLPDKQRAELRTCRDAQARANRHSQFLKQIEEQQRETHQRQSEERLQLLSV